MAWIDNGTLITAEMKAEIAALEAELAAKKAEVAEAMAASTVSDATIAQAKAWVRNKLADKGIPDAAMTALAEIFDEVIIRLPRI